MKTISFISTPSKAIYVHSPDTAEHASEAATNSTSFFVLLKMRTGAPVGSGWIALADAMLKKVYVLEQAVQREDPGEFGAKHFVRMRAIFFDDKNGAMTLHLDYLHDDKTSPLRTVDEIKGAMDDGIGNDENDGQVPNVVVTTRKVTVQSDYFDPDHDDYYTDDLRKAIYW